MFILILDSSISMSYYIHSSYDIENCLKWTIFKNLKEILDEAISKRSQVNTHPKCGFSCQYCLQVPNGLSYSLNCGHLPFCNQCSQSILHNEILSKRICPICTEKVISRQKVFVNLMKCGNGKNANENDTNVVVLQWNYFMVYNCTLLYCIFMCFFILFYLFSIFFY